MLGTKYLKMDHIMRIFAKSGTSTGYGKECIHDISNQSVNKVPMITSLLHERPHQ